MPRYLSRTPFARAARAFLALLTLTLYAPALTAGGKEVWLQVDTAAMELRVLRGHQVIRVFEHIALGRSGTTVDKRQFDGKTPLGEFKINRIKNDSSFHRFFAFDYPRLEQAERALKRGALDGRTYLAIRDAIRARRPPPQETVLGGYLGIHGIGEGDPEIHRNFNWTNGCVAITNEEVDELAQWVKIGTRVVVY